MKRSKISTVVQLYIFNRNSYEFKIYIKKKNFFNFKIQLFSYNNYLIIITQKKYFLLKKQ